MSHISYLPVCKVSELQPGERLFLEISSHPIVIINHGREYFALDDLCTHDDGPLGDGEVENHEIICPRHGARFNLRTGEATTLPAVSGVNTYLTRIVDDHLEIGFLSN